MLLKAMQEFSIDSTSTLYIGDEFKDSIAASSAGIDYVIINKEAMGKFVFDNLAQAIPIIKSKVYKID